MWSKFVGGIFRAGIASRPSTSMHFPSISRITEFFLGCRRIERAILRILLLASTAIAAVAAVAVGTRIEMNSGSMPHLPPRCAGVRRRNGNRLTACTRRILLGSLSDNSPREQGVGVDRDETVGFCSEMSEGARRGGTRKCRPFVLLG